MTAENAPYLVVAIIAAVFVASSLVGRRIPFGTAAKMIAAWVAIFIVVIWLFLVLG